MCNRTNSVKFGGGGRRKKEAVSDVFIYKALNRVYAIFRAVQMLSEDGYTPFGALNVSHNTFWKVAVNRISNKIFGFTLQLQDWRARNIWHSTGTNTTPLGHLELFDVCPQANDLYRK